MKHLETQTVMKPHTEVISEKLECDRCHRRFEKGIPKDDMEIQEMLNLNKTGGYGSIFGDMCQIECDICQYCLLDMIGPFCRLTDLHSDDTQGIAQGLFKIGDRVAFGGFQPVPHPSHPHTKITTRVPIKPYGEVVSITPNNQAVEVFWDGRDLHKFPEFVWNYKLLKVGEEES